MTDVTILKPGHFYWAKPTFDVDFTPPGFGNDETLDELFEASCKHWWNSYQPALYLGNDKWVWLGAEREDWPACWVGEAIVPIDYHSKLSKKDDPKNQKSAPSAPINDLVKRLEEIEMESYDASIAGTAGRAAAALEYQYAELTRLRERNAELEKDMAVGWLYDNPDTGQEFSEQHPIESGEVDDAENVRVATPGELNKALLDAWRSLEEQRIDHDARGRDAYARIASLEATVGTLREALKPFAQYAPSAPSSIFPNDAPFTQGSPIAKKQLTFGDLRRARTTYATSESVVVKSEGEKDGE